MVYYTQTREKVVSAMAKVAILVPQEEMCSLAAPLVPEFGNISLMRLQYVDSNDTNLAVSIAKDVEEEGCEVIIARGVQSRMIKYNTTLSVVDIQITAQELGMVVLDIKRELSCDRPRIALILIDNMVGDTSHFSELFDVDWQVYFVRNSEQLTEAVDQAKADGCRAVIGGNIVCEKARALSLPHRFLPASAESMRNALEAASRVCFAIDQKKQSLTEMDTMLNNTFSGIMQVDSGGVIQRINRTGYTLLNQKPAEMLGRKAVDVIANLTQKHMDTALLYGEESYAFAININQKAVVVNIAPIQIDEQIRGAILTFQEGKRIIDMDKELRQELYQRGYVARHHFDSLICKSPETEKLVKTAKRIAQYSAPVFITGEAGSGKSIIAQCIHNESFQKNSAFIHVDCSVWQSETLDSMLFGDFFTRKDSPACLAELAQNGTLYLSHVETLVPEIQFKVLNLTRGRFIHNGSSHAVSASVRVIASSECNLLERVGTGDFRSDLFYALNVLSLEVPPMRRRKEDVPEWVEFYLDKWQSKYNRYLQLTSEARKYIKAYDWPGNLEQIRSTCERVVLMMEKRNVDEAFLRKQIEYVTPKMTPNAEKIIVVKDPKALEISRLLTQCYGNREKVAAELGISKTTLWRYMKKYGIEAK